MERTVSGTGETEVLKVNELQNNFKLTLGGFPQNGFNGTWGFKFSLDGGNEWLDHEELKGLSDMQTGNLFFPVTHVKGVTTGANKGEVKFIVIQGA